MKTRKPFLALAATLQEAADELSHGDICTTLSHELHEQYPNQYCYVCDVFGDEESGDLVYNCAGCYYRCSYTISGDGDSRSCDIDTDGAVEVLPHIGYDTVADDDDDDDMEEGLRTGKLLERFPGSQKLKWWTFIERFISKGERDSADDSDFAGAHRSFPILRKSDVMAAVRSIGRGVAGGQSSSSLKSRIKSIAKRKGWASALPSAWQDDDKSGESRRFTPDGVLLVESACHFLETPQLKEAAMQDFPIKLISPGRGSSGYYPSDVLKKAAEGKIFKAGTQMFWNHATDAEESQRPEGDLNSLAAVTTTDATYDEAGRDGPGLYARAKVFSDYADKVKEKGPHIGLSIRAGGTRDEAAAGPDGKRGVITALKNAQSVDFVTKAGRDGKIFTESATAQEHKEGDDMDKTEVQALIKESLAPLQAENVQLKQQLVAMKAPRLIYESLGNIRLPDAVKQKIVEAIAPAVPLTESGAVDMKKLDEMVEKSAKEWFDLLPSLGYKVDVAAAGVRMTEAELKEAEKKTGKAIEQQFEEAMGDLVDVMVGPKLVKGSADETSRQLRKLGRKAFTEGRATA